MCLQRGKDAREGIVPMKTDPLDQQSPLIAPLEVRVEPFERSDLWIVDTVINFWKNKILVLFDWFISLTLNTRQKKTMNVKRWEVSKWLQSIHQHGLRKSLYRWWNYGTDIKTGRLVGTDSVGNKFYENLESENIFGKFTFKTHFLSFEPCFS